MEIVFRHCWKERILYNNKKTKALLVERISFNVITFNERSNCCLLASQIGATFSLNLNKMSSEFFSEIYTMHRGRKLQTNHSESHNIFASILRLWITWRLLVLGACSGYASGVHNILTARWRKSWEIKGHTTENWRKFVLYPRKI